MKISQLKSIMKESIREVFQEELKEILLEALKSPRPVLQENFQPYLQQSPYSPYSTVPSNSNPVENTPTTTSNNFREELRKGYADLVNEANGNPTKSTSPGTFVNESLANTPGLVVPRNLNTAAPNSALPEGEVSLEQIINLTNKS